MVTAIVIPIICIYFYYLTKKEMKIQNDKWLKSGEVKEEAMVIGTVESIYEERTKYYYHRYILITEIKLKTEFKMLTVKKITPLTNLTLPIPISVGDKVRLYGDWKEHYFQFNRYEIERA
ncbi:hypothetical protein SM124_02770 [Bacillus sp. 31A1R]|uniref:DUF3221 domain-containing protein n=1 Tax=Robertmurraya mangrovi TaxID=3098077 RepID=A0ABU5IU44_9BACI|nr:hypothetical protein [Bacillus sp. 31A1R]MDZ5470666.1 hypothetical protein [Bacillus sp. 31A1R]